MNKLGRYESFKLHAPYGLQSPFSPKGLCSTIYNHWQCKYLAINSKTHQLIFVEWLRNWNRVGVVERWEVKSWKWEKSIIIPEVLTMPLLTSICSGISWRVHLLSEKLIQAWKNCRK